MTTPDKDTIYIDIDDEITGIIDKLHASHGKVVALVLPKRASVFQSIVNMKLLKRAADASHKHLVLITAEAGLLPLAGVAGIHVAKTLTSKPEIPSAPGLVDDHEEAIEEDNTEPELNAETAGDQPVGKLAGLGAAVHTGSDGVETLMLDDEDLPPEADAAVPGPKKFDPPKGKKNKGLRIPNFNRFRLLLAAGVLGLILLIVGLVAALTILPKAHINIDTNAINVDSNLNLNLSTAAKSLKTEDNTVPAKLVQQQKTYVQQATTTGQKNTGNKATGVVRITNCSQTDDITVPAGTGLSSGGNTYIGQETVTVPVSSFKKGSCQNDGFADVNVVAQSPGASYNLPAGAAYTIAGGSSSLSAHGAAVAGGTDNIVQTVNQNDINAAKAKITTTDATVKQALQDQLDQLSYYAVSATYNPGAPAITTSANVGDAANNVTVTEIVTYTMFGVHQGDLKKLIDDNVKTQIDPKQSILSEGLDKAKFTVTNGSETGAQVALSTVATAGPDLDVGAIKKAAAGQKSGKIKGDLENRAGVKSVSIKLSPFWVSSIPKKTDKIIVTIAEPKAPAASHSNGSQP